MPFGSKAPAAGTSPRRRRPRSKPVSIAVVVGLTVLCADLAALAQGGGDAAPVRVSRAESLTVMADVILVGDVEPIRDSTVASKEAETVLEFPHREGEYVEKGELLAQLDSTVLELELAAATALLQARQQELAELENGTRTEIVAATRGRLRAAEAMRLLATLKFERTTRLNLQNAASKEDFDEQKALLEGAKGLVDERRAELEEAERGPRAEKIAQAKALALSQQAIVNRLEAKVRRHQVVAPFAGFITKEHTQVGEWVDEGGPVVDLVQLDEVDVRVLVPSRYSGRVKLGQDSVAVEVDALDALIETSAGKSGADAPRLDLGKIIHIVPEVDRKSRLFPVRIRLANLIIDGQPVLKAGMLARASLPVGEKREGIFVPKDALVLGAGTYMVFVVRSPESGVGKVEPMPVRLGTNSGRLVQVIGGVADGDLVVVQGNERLRPGQSVAFGAAPRPPVESR